MLTLSSTSPRITDFSLEEEAKVDNVSLFFFLQPFLANSLLLCFCFQDDIDENDGVNVQFDDSDDEKKEENVIGEIKG